jgi:predicted transcriptional regulator
MEVRTVTPLKREVISLVRRLPDDASLDDIIHALYVRAKIERGEREIREGKGIPHEEARKRILRKWAT